MYDIITTPDFDDEFDIEGEMCLGYVIPGTGREDYCGALKPADAEFCDYCLAFEAEVRDELGF